MNTSDYIEKEQIYKGWSADKKYCLTDKNGEKYLYRISPENCYESKKKLFSILQKLKDTGISMATPIEFGTCEEGVYTLESWINGDDAQDILPLLDETQQYVLGLSAGQLLREIHAIPAPETQENWEIHFSKKTEYKISKYLQCGLKFDGDHKVIDYLQSHRHLLKNRPQCFQHGDFHTGNMMIDYDKLHIIDFGSCDYGDPWEEFNRIVWSAQCSPYFATGQLNGYFAQKPPMAFWELLKYYIFSNTLSSIYWAIPFGQDQIDTMYQQVNEVIEWYDDLDGVIPKWYIEDFYFQTTDGIPYKLKSPPYSKIHHFSAGSHL